MGGKAIPISCVVIHFNLGNPMYMGKRYRRITENDGLLEEVGTNFSVSPDIVCHSTSNTILFCQINNFHLR
jgi:hypothetical protein